jgi:hypothetical protein
MILLNQISIGTEQKIHRLAVLVDRPIEKAPLALV